MFVSLQHRSSQDLEIRGSYIDNNPFLLCKNIVNPKIQIFYLLHLKNKQPIRYTCFPDFSLINFWKIYTISTETYSVSKSA